MKNKGHALRAHCIDWLSMLLTIYYRTRFPFPSEVHNSTS